MASLSNCRRFLTIVFLVGQFYFRRVDLLVDASSEHVVTFRWAVDEELEAGAVVGDVRRSLAPFVDPAALDRYEYQFLKRPNLDLSSLVIDRQSGIVRTSDVRRLDRESVCPQHHVRVAAECIIDLSVGLFKNFQLEQVVSIKIILLDVNDNAPVFAQPQYDIRFSESTPVGTSVALPTATDADTALKHGVVGYRLKTRHREFQLKSSHRDDLPHLVLAAELRLDSGPYSLILEAYDGGLPVALTGSTVIVVSVEDANDNAPIFERTAVSIEVREDFPLSEPIFVAQANDQDRGANADIGYSLDTASQQKVGHMFKIQRTSGEVYLKEALDYERETEYSMVIFAIDGGAEPLTGSQTLTVRVTDVNDNKPMISVNILQSATASTSTGNGLTSPGSGTSRGHVVDIVENADPGSFVGHVSVFDDDSGAGGLVACRLEQSSSSFQLTRLFAGQYKLTTSKQLDYEVDRSLPVAVTCFDNGQPPLTTTVNITVNVVDVNDNAPQFIQSLYNVSIDENTASDITIVQVKAVDADSGLNGEVSYSLADDDQSAAQLIEVDEKTGAVRLKASVDHELHKHLVFTVRARDGGANHLWDSTEVVVTINDVNDEEPVFLRSHYTFQVAEHAAQGTEVGHVTAVDRDAHPFNRHVFKIVDAYSLGVNDLFAIDPKSGKIITTAEFDRELQSSYKFTVVAIDEDLPILRSEVPVVVEVLDVNDNSPVFEFPADDNRTFAISSAVPPGYSVVRVVARDSDTGNNSRIAYRVSSDRNNVDEKDAFQINSSTGLLTTSADLSRAGLHSYHLRVIAHDHGVPPRTSSVAIQIVVDPSIEYVADRLLQSADSSAGTGSDVANGWYQTIASDNLSLIVAAIAICVGLVVIVVVVAFVTARICTSRRRLSTPLQNVYQCRVNEEKAMQKIISAGSMGSDGGVAKTTVGSEKSDGNGKSHVTAIGSMTSLQSGKLSLSNGAYKGNNRSAGYSTPNDVNIPLMQATVEEMKLLKALKEDLSDSECNVTENDLYAAINTDHYSDGRCDGMSPYDVNTATTTTFCQVPNGSSGHHYQPQQTLVSIPTCRYSPVVTATKNGFARPGTEPIPPYNTITSSTFKVHQHPLTYNGLVGTLPITTSIKDVARDRYATISSSPGGGGPHGGSVLAYQTTGGGYNSMRFPAHCAALGVQCRAVDGGYFTDDRQQSDGDSGSPVGSP